MPGFKINSSKNDNNERESQKVSGPLGEILTRLNTNMKEDARGKKEMAGDLPARDLTPSATFEPSMGRAPSPINFHASDAMDIDDEDISENGGFFNTGLSRSPPYSDPMARTKLAIAQDYLCKARETILANPNHQKEIKAPTSSDCRSPTWARTARPKFAEREDPKAQLMGVVYGDSSWVAERILDEPYVDPANRGTKTDRGSLWDEL